MAAMVATSPAMPPAPLGSLALKLMTQAGAAARSVSLVASVGVVSGLMGGLKAAGFGRREGPADLQPNVKNVAYVPTEP